MYITDLKTGYYYYIQARYLRGFERYYGKVADIKKVLSIKVVEKPQQEYWTTLKVSCFEYKNPKSKDGVWYIQGKYISKIREEQYNYKYYLKITYVNDKYAKNRNRILETTKPLLEYHNVFKEINSTIMQNKPLYIPIESNTNKAGFEIVKIKDIHKVAYDDDGKQVHQYDDKWLLDPDYNPQLGILNRNLVKTQLVYLDYVKSVTRANTFCEEEYDKLQDEWAKAKNDVTELKITVAELKDTIANKDKIIQKIEESAKQSSALCTLKTKNYIELLRKYNELHDRYEELQDNNNNLENNETIDSSKYFVQEGTLNGEPVTIGYLKPNLNDFEGIKLERKVFEANSNPDNSKFTNELEVNVYGSKLEDVNKIKELEDTIKDLKNIIAEKEIEIYQLKNRR